FKNREDYKPGTVPLEEQDNRKLFCKYHYKGVLVILIPLVLAPMFLAQPILVFRFLYLTFCFYLYYILNVIARGASAFIYITLIPICGIESSKPLSITYYGDLIFLVYACVIMGCAMDTSKVSDRLAIDMLRLCSGSIKRIQIFLTLFVLFTSAMVNPTLAAAFGMKVAQAALVELDKGGVIKLYSEEKPYEVGAKPYPTLPAVGVFLSCGYAAALGGMMSPFVNPNGVTADNYKGLDILGLVMITAGPALIGVIAMIVWIQCIFFGMLGGKVKAELQEGSANRPAFNQALVEKKAALGSWNSHAKLTYGLILFLFILVGSRQPNLWNGWDKWIGGVGCGLSVPAVFVAILFFAVAANFLFCRYYICREPEKSGTAPSLVGWKSVNTNCPWADIFMLGGAVSGIVCGVPSTYYATVVTALKTDKGGPFLHSLYGALYGTLLTSLGPGTTVAQFALPIVLKAGHTFALPFATSLNNSFLLPTSSPANTIVSGWGNVRPYLFV
ncbi:hypothetical protein KR026_001810, partial [Drosophila bipectinata]